MAGRGDSLGKPLGYQQITSLSAATALTVPTGSPNARIALIQAEAQSVRWRDDGTDPSATVGTIITANSILLYDGDLSAIKFFEAAGGGILNVSYYS